jgi:hypothetical protein
MLLVINKNIGFAYAAGGLVGIAVAFAPAIARAQDAGTTPLCNSFNGGNVAYFTGSTAAEPIMRKLATLLPSTVGIVYIQTIGSCQGLTDMLMGMKETASSSSEHYMNPDGTVTNCVLPDVANGQLPDVAVADVYATTCAMNAGTPPVTSGFKEFLGPIQVMTMITRKESTESSISADAAYTVFGFGGQMYQVLPWTDPTQLFIRSKTSGTLNMIGAAIGLQAPKWLVGAQYDSQRKSGSSVVLSSLQTASSVNASLGIVAADYADQYRSPTVGPGGTTLPAIKVLAYKHTGQSCGYLPDSDSTHYDKINVRQGRYAIWGPVHMTAAVDAGGTPTSAAVATILQYFAAIGPSPDATLSPDVKKSMIDATADAFTIPWCAMQVQRSGEISAPTPYQPLEPCGCYYESHKASTVTTCTPCADDTACSAPTPKCRYGFCEAR